MKAGTDVSLSARVLAYNDLQDSRMSGRILVRSSTTDPQPNNNSAPFNVSLLESPAHASLSTVVTTDRNPIPEGATSTVFASVHNAGSDAAPNVMIRLLAYDGHGSYPLTELFGDGWNCNNITATCTRAELAAGETTTITFRFVAPSQSTTISVSSRVAAEKITDPNRFDNFGATSQSVGNPSNYERVLLPITVAQTPGAFGSKWHSDLWMKIDSDAAIEIAPINFFCVIGLCPPPYIPLGKAFRAGTGLLHETQPGEPQGSLMYFKNGQTSRVTFNLRIQDSSRASETWGTEIPVIRENQFRIGTTALINIPLDSHFRQMLRVYDPDARLGASIVARIFDNDGAMPLVEIPLQFQVRDPNNFVTTALLPFRPGCVQLELSSIPEVRGHEGIRIELQPLTPQLRYWVFVSITNNETQHVTTITPQ